MTKKLLKQLAQGSYKGNSIDIEKIEEILPHLTRKELKEFVVYLKAEEKRRTVLIETPTILSAEYKEKLVNLFPDKKLQFSTVPSLLLGIKVTANDMIYENTLENTLSDMVEYVE